MDILDAMDRGMAYMVESDFVDNLSASCTQMKPVPRNQFCYLQGCNSLRKVLVKFVIGKMSYNFEVRFGRTFLLWTVGPRMVVTRMNSFMWLYGR